MRHTEYYVRYENAWIELKRSVEKMGENNVPQWQKDAHDKMVTTLKLDASYWTEDKIGDQITRGEMFAVLDKLINNITVKVGD